MAEKTVVLPDLPDPLRYESTKKNVSYELSKNVLIEQAKVPLTLYIWSSLKTTQSII